MSWTGGTFDFKDGTSKENMMEEIEDCLNRNRGYFEPAHLPLKLLHEIPILSDYDAAEGKLSDLYSKYGRNFNYGVRYYVYPEVNPSKKMESIKERITETEQKIKEYEKKHAIATFKAEYVGCPKCGSKLKRELLSGNTCPLCRTDMRSDTTLNTLKGYRQKIAELRKQYKQEMEKQQAKLTAKREIMWLVNAEAYIG